MFAGYAMVHIGEDCYCMRDLETGGIHETRDVMWLKRMYFQKKLTAKDVVIKGAATMKARESGITSIWESVPDVHDVQEIEVDNTEQENEEEDDEEAEPTVTQSGHNVVAPTRIINEIGAAATGYYEVGCFNRSGTEVLQDYDEQARRRQQRSMYMELGQDMSSMLTLALDSGADLRTRTRTSYE
jgi:hypothetical protein